MAASTLEDVVRAFVRLAEIARRDGLLALEAHLNVVDAVDDEGFLRDALAEVVDGTPAAYIAEVMQIRIAEFAKRLERERQDRVLWLRMLLTGVLAIQAGDAPRPLRAKLASYLSPVARAALSDTQEMLPARKRIPRPPTVPSKRLPTLKTADDFTFEHIRLLRAREVQRLARELDMKDLALALRRATKRTRECLLRQGMSPRAAEQIEADIAAAGPQRVSAIEEAQRRIVSVVRRLHEVKKLSLPLAG